MDNQTESPKTIFILGAGASNDCGFESNEQLIDRIAAFYNDETHIDSIKRIIFNARGKIIADGLLDCLPKPIADHLSSGSSFMYNQDPNIYSSWTRDLIAYPTIDDYIFAKKDRSLFAKLGILFVITKNERQNLFEPNGFDGFKRIWYHKFWTYLTENIYTYDKYLELAKKIKIISFNYDRSLDYFIERCVESRFGEEQARSSKEGIHIEHIYGKLGEVENIQNADYNPYLPLHMDRVPNENRFQVPTVNPIILGTDDESYKFELYDKHLISLASKLITFGEKTDIDYKNKIKKYVLESEKIYFFGFSFHKNNMSILFGEDNEPFAFRRMEGTCYKMPLFQIPETRTILKRRFPGNIHFLDESKREIDLQKYMNDYSVRL